MTARLLLFILRRHSPSMQKRLVQDLLCGLGLSRSQARAASSHIHQEQ